jgi:hypothetical protein
MNIELESMALEMPHVASHPNRVPFRGVLTFIDSPSDKPPSGARGHRVMLTRAATEQALPSLLGMAIDYAPSLDRHDARRKIGVITSAEICDAALASTADVALASSPAVAGASSPAHPIKPVSHDAGAPPLSRAHANDRVGNLELGTRNLELVISGFLYAKDFPEVVQELRSGGRTVHGMSYEIADAHIADLTATIWQVTEFTFTGAALLKRNKAAYRNTWIELAAAGDHLPTTQPSA